MSASTTVSQIKRLPNLISLKHLISLKGGNAEGLYEAMKFSFKQDVIPWEKLVGYASDGENLMQGQNGSLFTRLRDQAPGIYVLKCFFHSFHLIASHSCEKLSTTAEPFVRDVYSYFKNSPSRQQNFEDVQKFIDIEPHKMSKPCQTRWLSLSQCVSRVLEQWKSLFMFFTSEVFETESPQAERILFALKTPYVKAT